MAVSGDTDMNTISPQGGRQYVQTGQEGVRGMWLMPYIKPPLLYLKEVRMCRTKSKGRGKK